MSFYFLLLEVFLPGGQAAPDVPLLLILVQNMPDLGIQGIAAQAQLLCQCLVDGGFGNAEVPGSGSDGGTGFDHVHSQFTGSLLQLSFHRLPSDAVLLEDSMRLDIPIFRR